VLQETGEEKDVEELAPSYEF